MPELSIDEWRKEGRRLKREGLSIEKIQEKIGKYNGTFRLENSNSKGINFRNVSIRNARAELEKVPEASRDLFPKGLDPKDPNSFEEYKRTVAQDKIGIDARTKLASQERGIKYNKGHGQSAKTGGPTSSRNLMLENGSRNSAHGAANPNRASLLNTGVSTSWKEDAINYQDSSGLPLEYTPKDKQRIRNAPADMVDDVTAEVDAARWKAIKENPNARPIRTNPNPKVVNPPTKQNFHGLTIDKSRPGIKLPKESRKLSKGLKIPLVAGLSAAGLALVDGASAMDAAAAGLDAENPLDGGSFADGTVTGQRQAEVQNPQNYGKKGPAVTTPQQSNRAALLRKDPTQERGYETLGRVIQQGSQMFGGWLKKLGIQ